MITVFLSYSNKTSGTTTKYQRVVHCTCLVFVIQLFGSLYDFTTTETLVRTLNEQALNTTH